jgi:endonuclease/exonuclease/phosphatase (EEP) superfamily protein YafD
VKILTSVARRAAPAAPPAQRRCWPRLLLVVLCWLYPALMAGLWALLYFAADHWWPATALMFAPRWPWGLPAVVLALPAYRVRRRLLGPLAGALVILVGPIMGLCVPLPDFAGDDPGSPVLRVLTCNVHRSELDARALDELIAEARPDVVALQEWTSRHEGVFAGGGWHVRRDGELYLASRYPIRKVEVLNDHSFSGGRWGAVARYELETPAGLVRFLNVHLASPHDALEQVLHSWGWRGSGLGANSSRRRQQALAVLSWLALDQAPLVLAGDFNTPPESRIYLDHWSRYSNAFASRGLGFGHTYFTRLGSVRIDHILAGPGWRCRRCWVGPDVGSAHRPVIAELVREGQADSPSARRQSPR